MILFLKKLEKVYSFELFVHPLNHLPTQELHDQFKITTCALGPRAENASSDDSCRSQKMRECT